MARRLIALSDPVSLYLVLLSLSSPQHSWRQQTPARSSSVSNAAGVGGSSLQHFSNRVGDGSMAALNFKRGRLYRGVESTESISSQINYIQASSRDGTPLSLHVSRVRDVLCLLH